MADNPEAMSNAIAGVLVTEVCRTRGNEQWIEDLGTPFVEVRFYVKGAFVTERHVDDPDTLEETIKMGLARLGARTAIFQTGDQWALVMFRAGKGPRLLPSREAAEMVAIHRG